MRSSVLLTTTLSLLITFSSALPINKRALTLRAFNDVNISGGVGGNAEQEALDVWTAGIDANDLANVSDEDLDVLKVERENAEDAETEAFNPAIEAATGAEKDALSVGKTKNKVFKLTGLELVRRIDIAKKEAAGDAVSDSDRAKLLDSQTKLAKNIATDVKNAGKASQSVNFVGQTSV